uniref:Uncharacterized protein n=1 Tax=Geospiza parvula TaxID=87175 RepID=A0A8U8BWY7_GEOPR
MPSALNTGGSLPDLTTLHFPSPLPTPLDPEEAPYPPLSGGSSTSNLATTMTHLGISGGGVGLGYDPPGRPPGHQQAAGGAAAPPVPLRAAGDAAGPPAPPEGPRAPPAPLQPPLHPRHPPGAAPGTAPRRLRPGQPGAVRDRGEPPREQRRLPRGFGGGPELPPERGGLRPPRPEPPKPEQLQPPRPHPQHRLHRRFPPRAVQGDRHGSGGGAGLRGGGGVSGGAGGAGGGAAHRAADAGRAEHAERPLRAAHRPRRRGFLPLRPPAVSPGGPRRRAPPPCPAPGPAARSRSR